MAPRPFWWAVEPLARGDDPLELWRPPEQRQIIRWGSPALDQELRAAEEGQCPARPGLRRALERYLVRCTTSPQSDQLFAAVAEVEAGGKSAIALASPEKWRVLARVCLGAATDQVHRLVRDRGCRDALLLRFNESLFVNGSIGQFFDNTSAPTQLKTIHNIGFLHPLLDERHQPTSWSALRRRLMEQIDLNSEEADGLVEDLVTSGILRLLHEPHAFDLPEQQLFRTLRSVLPAEHPLCGEIETICQLTAQPAPALGKKAQRWLDQLRSHPWARPPRSGAEGEPETAQRIQPLLQIAVGRGSIDQAVMERLGQTIASTPFFWGRNSSRTTRRAVVAYFQAGTPGKRVPLFKVAMDLMQTHQEFAQCQQLDTSQQLDLVPPRRRPQNVAAWENPLWQPLAEQLLDGESAGRESVELDLERMTRALPTRTGFSPPRFCECLFSLVPQGDGLVPLLHSAALPGSASSELLLGGQSPYLEQLRSIWALEQQETPAILADITWRSPARGPVGPGETALRPSAFPYQIVLDGNPSVDSAHQIFPEELDLFLLRGEPCLWWRKRRVRVIPQLRGTAAVANDRTPLVNLLLCCTDALVTWSVPTGGELARRVGPRIPRLLVNGVVVAPRQWEIPLPLARMLAKAEPGCESAVPLLESWREHLAVPRHVRSGSSFPRAHLVDLEANWGLAELSRACARDERIVYEAFPENERSLVQGPDGPHCSQLLGCLELEADSSGTVAGPDPERVAPADGVSNTFSPGGPWLYTKVYLPVSLAEGWLATVVNDLVQRLTGEGLITRFHFVRYLDPEFHLRLRFRHDPPMHQEVLAIVRNVLDGAVSGGVVRTWCLERYQRDVDRLGGPAVISAAEELCTADSLACLYCLSAIENQELNDVRLCWSARTIQLYFDAFGFSLEAQLDALTRWHDGKAAAYEESERWRQALADHYRRHGDEVLREICAAKGLALRGLEPMADDPEIAEVFAELSQVARSVGARYLAAQRAKTLHAPLVEVCGAFIDRHLNRLLGTEDRVFVILDLLQRATQNTLARTREED